MSPLAYLRVHSTPPLRLRLLPHPTPRPHFLPTLHQTQNGRVPTNNAAPHLLTAAPAQVDQWCQLSANFSDFHPAPGNFHLYSPPCPRLPNSPCNARMAPRGPFRRILRASRLQTTPAPAPALPLLTHPGITTKLYFAAVAAPPRHTSLILLLLVVFLLFFLACHPRQESCKPP